MSPGKKVLVVQPNLGGAGGGGGVCAWILQALCERHAVTALTWNLPDLAAFDHYFGTSLRDAPIRILRAPVRARATASCVPGRSDLLRNSMLIRHCKRICDDYDVIISANNEWDLGQPGIQYIHYPWARLPRPASELRWFHFRPLLALYYAACTRIADFSFDRMAGNLTYVNSRWTAEKFREHYGLDSIVLHPPTIGKFPEVPWEQRENSFVCVGRISPEKRVELIIDILERVRQLGQHVHLHIVGTVDNRAYFRKIAPLIEANRAWITVKTNLSRPQLADLLAHHRYGIHAMDEEHFGMVVAEMVRAGCIPFVHDSGGPPEIVGDEPRLLYRDRGDAVAKIVDVLRHPQQQRELRTHLDARRRLFSVDTFVREIQRSVDVFPER